MTTFMTSLSVLSIKDDIDTVNILDGLKLPALRNSHEFYNAEKQACTRNKILKLKQNQKIKENVKELEQLFLNYRCIYVQWGYKEPLFLFFNSGTFATIKLDKGKSAIQKITIDNSLCGKLTSEHITDVCFSGNWLLISYSEPKLSYIYYDKHPFYSSKILPNKKKIYGFSPNINTIDLPGPSSRRLEKKLSVNNLKDCVLVWWKFSNNDVWPWMPVNYNADRINFLVYLFKGSDMNIVCSTKVHGELHHARFSRWHSNHILTIEEVKERERDYSVNICTYEISHGRCQCISLQKLPLNGHITAFDWTLSEDKVLLSGEDKSLLVYDLTTNTTLVTSTSFIVKEITCHPNGIIACVIGTNGYFQCFDIALTQLNIQIYSENLSSFDVLNLQAIFHPYKVVQKILWQHSTYNQNTNITSFDKSNSFLIYFETGFFVFFNFSFGSIAKNVLTPIELLSQYLKNDHVNESICLLQCLNWHLQSELCFQCLSKVSNFLLKKPLTARNESAIQLCLGTFYDSVTLLPENILLYYQEQIDHIARRFFYHLLRYLRFEKAYLLAVNLQSHDLFLDLHHVAKDNGQTVLAVVAFKHAEQLCISENKLNYLFLPDKIDHDSNENPCEKFKELSEVKNSKSAFSPLRFCHKSLNDVDFSIKEKCVPQHENTMKHFSQSKNVVNMSLVDVFFKENDNFCNLSKCSLERALFDPFKCYNKTKLKNNSQHTKFPFQTSSSIIDKDDSLQKSYCDNDTNKQTILEKDIEADDIEDTHVKFVHFGIV